MQLRKLLDCNPHFPTLCDKLASREYVAERVGDAHLIPLLWSGLPAEIPFDCVAPPYFLKSTHASGQIMLVRRGEAQDREAIRLRARRWLATDYGAQREEPGYRPVPPRLMIEQTVAAATGERPNELRMFVFDGKVAVINTVIIEDGTVRNGAFHTPHWTPLAWRFTRKVEREFPRPRALAEMIELAERLGAGLDHVRVDFYDCGDRFWIGELTVYSWSGYVPFVPDEADFELGAHWRMELPGWRAVVRMLVRGRRFAAVEQARARADKFRGAARTLERSEELV